MIDALKVTLLIGVVILSTLIFSSLVLICYLPCKVFEPKRNFLHKIAGYWARFIAAVVPGWKFKVTGQENLPDGPCMLVANHQSQTDILAVYLSGANFRWLSKDSVFKIPFIGWAMSAVGYVSVERGNRHSHIKCLDDSVAIIKSGIPMLFFPEGTRSEDGKLKPFKSGAFKVAHETLVPVVPIVIRGTHAMLRKHTITPKNAQVTIDILPPVYGKNESELMSNTYETIAKELSHHA